MRVRACERVRVEFDKSARESQQSLHKCLRFISP